MDGVVSASLFAVIDDIEAAFHLLCHDLGDRQRTAACSSLRRAQGCFSSASRNFTTSGVRGRLPV